MTYHDLLYMKRAIEALERRVYSQEVHAEKLDAVDTRVVEHCEDLLNRVAALEDQIKKHLN
jgi:hypothetical protein